jgi:lipoprotein-anchoring transpeptidase ErfK/SrfK
LPEGRTAAEAAPLMECEAFLLRLQRNSQELEALPLVNAYLVCNTKYQSWDSKMVRVSEHGAPVATGWQQPFGAKNRFSGRAAPSNSLWRIAVLAAAGAIGFASQAEAAIYWSDSDPGFSRPGPTEPQRGQKARRHAGKKIEAPGKQAAKPQGPLVIAISINKQNLKIYDANGFFAETPISTGMAGHSTPMGVFSVIQKQKLHHSNIYSGAPMPYMQRITWSGIAIHAGVLPGYPASHGCIRMPMAFAIKMWGWTKMGARVVVTPGEMMPASFSHPLLVAQKVVPAPIAADEPQADAPSAAKSDKASDADAMTKAATSDASLELKPTVGHDDGLKSVMDASSASASLREQTHTADAGASPATKAAVTMSDAAPSGDNAEAEPAIAERAEVASSDAKPVEAKAPEAATPDVKSAETDAADKAGKKPDQAQAPAQANGDSARIVTSAIQSMKADATKAEAKADDVKAEAPKADAPKSIENPDANVTSAVDIGTSVPDEKKDQTRLPDTAKASKPDAAMVAAPRRTGQISVFVSRKDSKLYVRQNFAPLFDVPVTIAPSDRPLGTHVFTAQVDKDDANVVHWSVVSLPVPAGSAERRDEDERVSRRRKMAGAAEMKAVPVPDSPAEALDRLTIPADAMARITEALSTGSSIIVSDQGIRAGETGEGTDFIVSLR